MQGPRRRGRGNPNSQGMSQQELATDMKKKFEAIDSTWTQEDTAEILAALPGAKRRRKRQFASDKLQTLSRLAKTGTNGEGQFEAQMNAWAEVLVATEAEDLEDVVDSTLKKEFITWLTGKGKDEHHRRTPWYRKPVLMELEDVRQYLDQFIDMKVETETQIAKLIWNGPQNLEECWRYFKFVVDQEWVVRDDKFIFLEFPALIDGASMGGGLTEPHFKAVSDKLNANNKEITIYGEEVNKTLQPDDIFKVEDLTSDVRVPTEESLRRRGFVQTLQDKYDLFSRLSKHRLGQTLKFDPIGDNVDRGDHDAIRVETEELRAMRSEIDRLRKGLGPENPNDPTDFDDDAVTSVWTDFKTLYHNITRGNESFQGFIEKFPDPLRKEFEATGVDPKELQDGTVDPSKMTDTQRRDFGIFRESLLRSIGEYNDSQIDLAEILTLPHNLEKNFYETGAQIIAHQLENKIEKMAEHYDIESEELREGLGEMAVMNILENEGRYSHLAARIHRNYNEFVDRKIAEGSMPDVSRPDRYQNMKLAELAAATRIFNLTGSRASVPAALRPITDEYVSQSFNHALMENFPADLQAQIEQLIGMPLPTVFSKPREYERFEAQLFAATFDNPDHSEEFKALAVAAGGEYLRDFYLDNHFKKSDSERQPSNGLVYYEIKSFDQIMGQLGFAAAELSDAADGAEIPELYGPMQKDLQEFIHKTRDYTGPELEHKGWTEAWEEDAFRDKLQNVLQSALISGLGAFGTEFEPKVDVSDAGVAMYFAGQRISRFSSAIMKKLMSARGLMVLAGLTTGMGASSIAAGLGLVMEHAAQRHVVTQHAQQVAKLQHQRMAAFTERMTRAHNRAFEVDTRSDARQARVTNVYRDHIANPVEGQDNQDPAHLRQLGDVAREQEFGNFQERRTNQMMTNFAGTGATAYMRYQAQQAELSGQLAALQAGIATSTDGQNIYNSMIVQHQNVMQSRAAPYRALDSIIGPGITAAITGATAAVATPAAALTPYAQGAAAIAGLVGSAAWMWGTDTSADTAGFQKKMAEMQAEDPNAHYMLTYSNVLQEARDHPQEYWTYHVEEGEDDPQWFAKKHTIPLNEQFERATSIRDLKLSPTWDTLKSMYYADMSPMENIIKWDRVTNNPAMQAYRPGAIASQIASWGLTSMADKLGMNKPDEQFKSDLGKLSKFELSPDERDMHTFFNGPRRQRMSAAQGLQNTQLEKRASHRNPRTNRWGASAVRRFRQGKQQTKQAKQDKQARKAKRAKKKKSDSSEE